MKKLIHITDTHLVPQGQTLHGINPLRRLQLAIDSINAEHNDADMVVFTGDLTNGGKAESYQLFFAEAKRLTIPYHVILGNHDSRKNFVNLYPEHPLDDNGFVQYTVHNDAGTFIMCDTLSGGDHGYYCEQRCAWLKQQLENAPANDDVYIFMHHPPMDCGFEPIDNLKLRNDEDVYKVLEPHKDKIRYMFFGHTHLCTSGIWRGIGYSITRSLVMQVHLLTGKRRTDRPSNSFESPAYGVVLLDDQSVIYHRYSFADTAPKLFIDWQNIEQYTPEQIEEMCKSQIDSHNDSHKKDWSDY